jgi:hypothetical protein
MSRFLYILISIIVAAGVTASGYFIGDGLRNIKKTDRFVNVRGVSEREVMADSAGIDIGIMKSGNDQTAVFTALKAVEKDAMAYLVEKGLKQDDIEVGQWMTSQPTAEEKKNDPTTPHFTTTGRLHVVTRDIAASMI